MKYLHPPDDKERLSVSGRYTVTADDTEVTETWECYHRSDGFAIWRVEQEGTQDGVALLRLGHLLVEGAGRPERLQIQQRGGTGLQRQTYTFFDDSVLVTDNRVAGRRTVELVEAWTLLTPFAAAGALALPFAPTRTEPAEHFVYVVRTNEDDLLEGRIEEVTLEPAGANEYVVGGTAHTGYGWRLQLQDQPEDVLWLTERGLTVQWERNGFAATLVALREGW